ncbi:hypothetical protein TNCV_3373661 [Trichonephila clavipes]|nr:hypothetical protein TNCV_3373661 [Trichonephila clavipes]
MYEDFFFGSYSTVSSKVVDVRIRQSHVALMRTSKWLIQEPQINQRTSGTQKEDVETWMAFHAEDCGYQMLNNDGIAPSVQEESDPVDDQTEEDEDNNSNESSKNPSNADAFSVLETSLERYEYNN